MQNHASKYQFEEAEKIKRKIKNIENFQSKSVVVDSNLTSLGVLNIVSHEKYAFVNAIQVMNGAITKSKTTVVQKKLDETDPEILYFLLAENINNFFDNVKEIILPFDLSFDYPINFLFPKRGDKKSLLMLSRKNALAKKIEYLKTEAIKNPETSISKLLKII